MAATQNELVHKTSLTAVLQKWLKECHCVSEDPMCYVGEHTAEAMADAAFAVLLGMADMETYFRAEKMLT